MADHTDEEWDEIAHAWRRVLELDDCVRLHAPDFLRRLKQKGYIKDYVCVPDRDLPSSEGKFNPDDGRLYYRQSIWDAAEKRNSHATWTVIHEASHAILKHQEVRYRANAAAQSRLSPSTNRDEFEAHRLTASILAPFKKSDFAPSTSVEDICQRFGLGQQAATKRRQEFERMYRQKNGVRRELPQGIVDFLVAQRRKG